MCGAAADPLREDPAHICLKTAVLRHARTGTTNNQQLITLTAAFNSPHHRQGRASAASTANGEPLLDHLIGKAE
jgi:hypothetical protein